MRKKILLLGSGELGKELVIEAKRLGLEVIAIDKYENAPAMHVADHSLVIDMSNKEILSKTIKELPLGRLASFDQLYDGISGVIRADKKRTMAIAQNQVSDKELRILKSLFLLKWVPQFKSTSRNVSILLINEISFDIQGHEQTVKDALIN